MRRFCCVASVPWCTRFGTSGGQSARPSSSSSSVPGESASLTAKEKAKIAKLIENDPRVLMEMIAHLDPNIRRRLIVTGGAMEWFGKESAALEVEKADADNDRLISPKDFDHWFEEALKRRRKTKVKDAPSSGVKATPGAAATTNAASTAASSAASTQSSSPATTELPFKLLALIAFEAALPFVGFGFLDNATMILMGDLIDGTLGFYLNCSVLASAAMGNVFSGMFGMQVHGLIDKAVQKLDFNIPALTETQMRSRRVFLAGHIGGTLGIMIGLVLGMIPLLFLDGDTNEKADYAMFHRWDINDSGFIELAEFEQVLRELGFTGITEKAQNLIEKYGSNNKMSFEQFCDLKDDLREGHPIFD